MTIDLSVSIMTVGTPERQPWIDAIVASGAAHGITVGIVYDRERTGCWPTARRCWESATGTHHLILSDDALLADNFWPSLLAAIEARPEHAIGLFANQRVCERARDKGDAWCTIPNGVWGVAQLLPANMIRGMLAWSARSIRPGYPHDDVVVAIYLEVTGRTVWATVPSIVEHAAPNASLLGYNNRTKVARVWTGVAPDSWPVPAKPLTGTRARNIDKSDFL